MATYGLRLRNAAGNVTVDISTRLPRLIYQWQIDNVVLSSDLDNSGPTYTSPAIGGLANDGTWSVYCPFACRMEWLGNQVRMRFFSVASNKRIIVSFFKV